MDSSLISTPLSIANGTDSSSSVLVVLSGVSFLTGVASIARLICSSGELSFTFVLKSFSLNSIS